MAEWGRNRRSQGEGMANLRRQGGGRGDGILPQAGGAVVTKRQGSVLRAELRGLTEICTQLAPAQLALVLQDLFAVLRDAAVANEALIERLTGDGLTLVYGLPRARRDDASRAVRTAVTMQHSFLCLRNQSIAEGYADAKQLGLRVGVGSGELTILEYELGGRAERTVLGEVMLRARRLCAAAERGNVLLDQRTYEQAARSCKGAMEFTSTDAPVLRGERLPAYRCTHRRSGLRLLPREGYRDPVCGATVDPRNSVDRTVAGEVHHFCSQGCAARYTDGPDLFTEGPIKRAGKRG